MNKKSWIENSSNMIVVYSIFAAIAGGLLVFVLQDKDLCENWKWPVLLFVFSFFLFSLTAERVAEAVSEEKKQKRIAYMFLYNIGVISLFFGGVLTIYYKYENPFLPIILTILSYIPSLQHAWWLIMITTIIVYILCWQQCWAGLLIVFFVFLAFIPYPQYMWCVFAFMLSIPWVDDVIWLIFINNKKFKEYFDFDDNIKPPSEGRLWEYIFYIIRYLHRGESFPHDDVYTRLQCSPIHGVGVFAIRDIPEGTKIFNNDDSKMIWVNKTNIGNIDMELLRLYDDFSVSKNGKLGCPKNFNMLTVGWYLNESKENPNVYCNDDYDFISLRDIKKGEELTVNYSTYSEHPKGLL